MMTDADEATELQRAVANLRPEVNAMSDTVLIFAMLAEIYKAVRCGSYDPRGDAIWGEVERRATMKAETEVD
jgi:hypothetical protein